MLVTGLTLLSVALLFRAGLPSNSVLKTGLLLAPKETGRITLAPTIAHPAGSRSSAARIPNSFTDSAAVQPAGFAADDVESNFSSASQDPIANHAFPKIINGPATDSTISMGKVETTIDDTQFQAATASRNPNPTSRVVNPYAEPVATVEATANSLTPSPGPPGSSRFSRQPSGAKVVKNFSQTLGWNSASALEVTRNSRPLKAELNTASDFTTVDALVAQRQQVTNPGPTKTFVPKTGQGRGMAAGGSQDFVPPGANESEDIAATNGLGTASQPPRHAAPRSDAPDHKTAALNVGSLEPLANPEFRTASKTAIRSVSVSHADPPAPRPASSRNSPTPQALIGAENFVLAAQPPIGDQWQHDDPQVDPRAVLMDAIMEDFTPDPIDECLPYDPYQEMMVYEGKTLYANQRPLVELGRPWYQLGQLSPGSNLFGQHNNAVPQFLIYGDFRSAAATNTQLGDNVTRSALELNLNFDLRLTATERFHLFISPFDNGIENAGYLFDDDEWVDQYDANIDFGYFEGDLGSMVGGLIRQTMPFDLPFTMGVIPMVIQNGVWMEDAFLGLAATVPARSSPRFHIANMDVTFFAGFDKITTPAFADDDSAGRMYGIASFIDALNGYIELDYAFLEDRTFDDRSYHNIAMGYTRRYGRWISNSTRVIVNAGQSTDSVPNTADGVLLLSENSLITGAPSTVVPYMNFFAGFDRPQSAARAVQAGGVLRNTGILFETDGMTNYPTLDPTANNTAGGALGLELLTCDFNQQLVVEAAWLNVMGDIADRNAPGNQYGVGFRYQLPLSNSVILRADGMYGFLDDANDLSGFRMELRQKF